MFSPRLVFPMSTQLSSNPALAWMTHFLLAFLCWDDGPAFLHLQKYQATFPCSCPHFSLRNASTSPSLHHHSGLSPPLEPTWALLMVPKPQSHPQPSSPASPVPSNWQNYCTKIAQIMSNSPQRDPRSAPSFLLHPSTPHPQQDHPHCPLDPAFLLPLLFLHPLSRGQCRDSAPSIC